MKPNWKSKTIFTGDNLHVMRGMNSGCVDLVYLDPPFNSNKAYAAPIGSRAAGAAFKDSWTLSDVDLVEHNRLKDENVGLYALLASARHAHSKGMFSYLVMMATRLIEMKRVLKPTGSIYLHCDPTASHYLKIVMDAIFGAENFRNEIAWKRFGSHNDAKRFGRVHDVLLFYAAGPDAPFNEIYEPYDQEYIERAYRYKDGRGRYATSPLQARSLSGGGYDYIYKGVSDTWKLPKERLEELDRAGDIHWPQKGKIPRRKVYLDSMKGVPARDLITDIKSLSSSHRERTGYPTQKPLALLRRVIEASSREGGVVFDPFCGCATTLVAADELRRDWVGIDISARAAELVVQRIRDNQGLFRDITARGDIPMRTDQGDELGPGEMADFKRTLYGLQEGYCNGCQEHFEARHLEMDHVTPRSKGGTNHAANLQLLCGSCNRRKGSRTQAEFKAELANERGVNLSWL